MSEPKVIWEHPDDWHMHEADFAKACSRLAYRLISISDDARTKPMADIDAQILERISRDVARLADKTAQTTI